MFSNPKLCFLMGHRDAPANIFEELEQTIEKHITELGVTEFIVGHYGNFDRMAASALTRSKIRHSEITLTMLIPYHPAERAVSVPDGFSGTFYPPGMETVPKRLAIVAANRYMVDHADYIIAYAWHPASNTRNLAEYATQKHKKMTYISPPG